MKTPLYNEHIQLGAKLVDFAGYEMPIQYEGIVGEHLTVRERVGVFDVSHMGRIEIKGEDAERFVDYLATNRISGKSVGSATYTVLCNEKGGSVDDVIFYRIKPETFFLVANASNCQKDLNHIEKMSSGFQVEIQEHFNSEGILALQGPNALPLLSKIFPKAAEMKPMRVIEELFQGEPIFIASTGYTGEKGVEFLVPNSVLKPLWSRLLSDGKEFGIAPIGLGARDTLRLEMGFALYGHELSDTIAPTESVSRWTVKLDKEQFVGKDSLVKLESPREEFGICLDDPGVPREGYSVFQNGQQIGVVTSGSFSPSLKKGIALAIGNTGITGDVEIQIRTHRAKGKIIPLPFYRRKT